MSLMGIVVGYHQCRGVAISARGEVLARVQRDYVPGREGWDRLDLTTIWPTVRKVIQTMSDHLIQHPVSAICFSSVGGPLLAVSSEGGLLGGRSVAEGEDATSHVQRLEGILSPETLYGLTGQTIESLRVVARLSWVRDRRPDEYYQTWRYLPLASFINYKLGGGAVCDPTLAASMALYNIRDGAWDRRVLNACQLPRYKLPDIVSGGTAVGTMEPGMAAELGLPAGVRLVQGALDLACRVLGAGAICSGMAAYTLGSSIELLPTFNAIALTPLMQREGLNMWPHVVPDLWLSRLSTSRGGAMLRWFCDHLAPLESRQALKRGGNVYTMLLSGMPEALDTPLVIPSGRPTGGDLSRATAQGAIAGLTLETTRGALLKGMLEGIAFESARLLGICDQLGLRVTDLRALGGGARSARWLQLSSDVLGMPLERLALGWAAALGAAILAGVGCGVYASVSEGAATVVRVVDRFEPDERRHARYRNKQARYWALSTKLAGLSLE